MFNSPRAAQRYVGPSTNTGFGGSFDNPLADSFYDDGLDPWSAAPSPSSTPIPRAPSPLFSSVIGMSTYPPNNLRTALKMKIPHSGCISTCNLQCLIRRSGFRQHGGDIRQCTFACFEHVRTTSSGHRQSKYFAIYPLFRAEFRVSPSDREPRQHSSTSLKARVFRCIGTCRIGTGWKRCDERSFEWAGTLTSPLDVSIEQVVALSSQNALPEPALDLSRIPPSTSWFVPPLNYRQTIGPPVRPSPPVYSYDPWNTNPRTGVPSDNPFAISRGGSVNGAPSSLAGTGLPSGWWKKQETVRVNILGPQGFILTRYMVYEIVTDVGRIFWCVYLIDVVIYREALPFLDDIPSLCFCGIV